MAKADGPKLDREDHIEIKIDRENYIEIEIMLAEQMMLAELIQYLALKAVKERWKAQGKRIDVVELNNAATAYLRENKWRLRAEAVAILSQTWELRQ